jgi:hypothetical protein
MVTPFAPVLLTLFGFAIPERSDPQVVSQQEIELRYQYIMSRLID